MAFTPDTLSAVVQSIGGAGIRIFTYETDDAVATVTGADYFAGADERGLRVSDLIFVSPLDDTYSPYLLVIDAVDADGNGTAVVSDAFDLGSYATQAEAEAGVVTDKTMNPLRTKQAIDVARTLTKTFSGVQTFSAVPVLSGGGIAFPATQVPSADVNVLDDYEEGTWTPTINAATPGDLTVAYGSRSGTYVKIGKVVVYNYFIQTSTFTHTTAAGLLFIDGLPFGTAGGFLPSGSVAIQGYTKAGYTPLGHETGSAGQTRLYVLAGGSGVNTTDLLVTEFPTGGTKKFYGSGTYIAS